MRIVNAARALLLAVLLAGPAFADGRGPPPPDVAAPPVRAAPITPAAGAAPIGQTGAIALPQGLGFALNVPRGYRFYSADEARAFLRRRNADSPPGEVLGLLAPAGERVDLPDSWATVIAYEPIGYVGADNAARLSDSGFEGEVRAARTAQSRPFEGFAAAPNFADDTPCVTWAERTAAPGAGGQDLRYEQRVLGRAGVIDLTSIGSADQMPAIAAAAPDYLRMITFAPGQRYADFDAASDQKARYDLPGLITGQPLDQAQGLTSEAAPAAAPERTAGGGLMGIFPWVAGGVIVLAGAGYLLMRRRAPKLDEDDAGPAPEA